MSITLEAKDIAKGSEINLVITVADQINMVITAADQYLDDLDLIKLISKRVVSDCLFENFADVRNKIERKIEGSYSMAIGAGVMPSNDRPSVQVKFINNYLLEVSVL